MTIWAEHREIIRSNVSPVSVDVLDLHWDFATEGVLLIPTTLLTALVKQVQQMLTNNAVEEWRGF
jgi:hypothetical protein